MALRFERNTILGEQSPTALQILLLKYATELALLGAIDQAQKLMSALFRSKMIAHASTALMNGLCYAWHFIGSEPDGVDWAVLDGADKHSSPVKQIIQDFMKAARHEYKYRWGGIELAKWTYDESGLELCLKADDSLEFDDPTEGSTAAKKSDRLVKALDISLRLSSEPWVMVQVQNSDSTEPKMAMAEQLDGRSDDILKQITDRWHEDGQLQALGLAENLWPIFTKGIVANVFGMSPEQVQSRGQEIIDLFTERLQKPMIQSVQPSMSIKELLEIGQYNTVCGAGNGYWTGAGIDTRPESYFQDPASEEAITSLEKRLGVELPDDYKEFLRITDGFHGDMDDGIYNGYCPDTGLLPAEKVEWNTEEHIAAWPVELLGELTFTYELNELVPRKTRKSSSGQSANPRNTPLPYLNRVIQIGARDVDYLWYVQPESVKAAVDVYNQVYENANEEQRKELMDRIEELAGSKEEFDSWADGTHWCCVRLQDIDLTGYASFRDYLEKMAKESAVTQ